METYSTAAFAAVGIDTVFVQDNQSYSAHKGVLRGIHFQNAPMAQAKLVRVTRGAVLDVAVDLRKGSPTYCQWVSVELSAENKRMREDAMQLLRVVGLEDVRDERATSLPYGKQRLLEIARALATEPSLLLLDEPAAGMNPQETEELGAFIQRIKKQFNLTILIIEHHMNLIMDISDRIYVVDFGRLIAQGTPDEIQNNDAVIAAYLGGDEA